MQTPTFWFRIGAIVAGLAVATGAFAAHGLEGAFLERYANEPSRTIAGQTVTAAWKYLQDFKTGAEYQMYHGLALLGVGLAARRATHKRALNVAGWSFMGGVLLFSGSLYLLAMTGQRKLGMITPIGGVLFLTGWVSLACACLGRDDAPATDSIPQYPH